jgi:hypothetical protein
LVGIFSLQTDYDEGREFPSFFLNLSSWPVLLPHTIYFCPFIFCSCPLYVQLLVLNKKRLFQNDSVLVNQLSEDYRRLYPLALRRKSTKTASEYSYGFLIRNSWNLLNFRALFYILLTSFLGRFTACMTAFIHHYDFGLSAPSVPQELALNKAKFTLNSTG